MGPPPILRAYGLEKPLEVFRLGLDLVDAPGDRVTPLDYPIPPGLSEAEARRRMRGTLDNALEALRFLARDPKGERVRLVLPVHGRTPEEAAAFAQKALRRVRKEGLAHLLWGLGLGSMVPLRKAHRTPEIVHFVRAVREAAPELPLHVFGVTGLLVPFLLQAGATSFDSAGYVQKARSLKYLVPGYRERRLPELLAEGDYPCSCPVCRGRSLVEDLEVLRSGEAPRGAKSAVYGAVALHNLGMDYALLEEAGVRQEAGELEGFLRELVAVHPRLSPLLLALGGKERKSKRLAAPKAASVPRRVRNDPEAFDWRKTDFKPQSPVLLLLPCATATSASTAWACGRSTGRSTGRTGMESSRDVCLGWEKEAHEAIRQALDSLASEWRLWREEWGKRFLPPSELKSILPPLPEGKVELDEERRVLLAQQELVLRDAPTLPGGNTLSSLATFEDCAEGRLTMTLLPSSRPYHMDYSGDREYLAREFLHRVYHQPEAVHRLLEALGDLSRWLRQARERYWERAAHLVEEAQREYTERVRDWLLAQKLKEI